MFSFFYRLFDRWIPISEKQIPTQTNTKQKKSEEIPMKEMHSKKRENKEIFPLNSFGNYLSFFAFERSYQDFLTYHANRKNRLK